MQCLEGWLEERQQNTFIKKQIIRLLTSKSNILIKQIPFGKLKYNILRGEILRLGCKHIRYKCNELLNDRVFDIRRMV